MGNIPTNVSTWSSVNESVTGNPPVHKMCIFIVFIVEKNFSLNELLHGDNTNYSLTPFIIISEHL